MKSEKVFKKIPPTQQTLSTFQLGLRRHLQDMFARFLQEDVLQTRLEGILVNKKNITLRRLQHFFAKTNVCWEKNQGFYPSAL